jgi:hypothetical protein
MRKCVLILGFILLSASWGQDCNQNHIASGNFHSLALTSSGEVVGWGYNSYGQIDVPDLVGLVDISCDCEGNVEDCFGVCGGIAEIDECGVCGGDGIPEGDCDCFGNVEDCFDVCGGGAEIDDCGICNGNNSDKDCIGVCFGDAILDLYGNCCYESDLDCAGVCFGESYEDDCEFCDDILENDNECISIIEFTSGVISSGEQNTFEI